MTGIYIKEMIMLVEKAEAALVSDTVAGVR